MDWRTDSGFNTSIFFPAKTTADRILHNPASFVTNILPSRSYGWFVSYSAVCVMQCKRRTDNQKAQRIWKWLSRICVPRSSDGIGTGYRLDGPGIESRWGARFSAPFQTDPESHPASCTMGTGSFPGVKYGWAWRWPLIPFWCRGQERVELFLYYRYGPYGLYRASVPVQGCTLPIFTWRIQHTIPCRHCRTSHKNLSWWKIVDRNVANTKQVCQTFRSDKHKVRSIQIDTITDLQKVITRSLLTQAEQVTAFWKIVLLVYTANLVQQSPEIRLIIKMISTADN